MIVHYKYFWLWIKKRKTAAAVKATGTERTKTRVTVKGINYRVPPRAATAIPAAASEGKEMILPEEPKEILPKKVQTVFNPYSFPQHFAITVLQ